MKINYEDYSRETKSHKVRGELINRELSWITFNMRVLYCASDIKIPLNERLKFLAISCSNMDEFISVRYANALQDKKEPKKKILAGILGFLKVQAQVYQDLKKELEAKNVFMVTPKDLSKKEKDAVDKIFMEFIFPMLTPINIGSTNEVPVFYSGQNCIAATVRQGEEDNLIILPISKKLDPMYVIQTKSGQKILMIEDIILSCLDQLFINKTVVNSGFFRVIKDSSIILDHDTHKVLRERMEQTIEDRELSDPFFMEVSRKTPTALQNLLMNVFDIERKHVFAESELIDYTRFMSRKLLSDKHSYPPFEPVDYGILEDENTIFSAISAKDILLHHPYDSYSAVVKFIEHAAEDPDVLGIKQTLYRVSSEDSPIVNALCKAAKQGKTVSVLIEIKARFDEERNISLINKLKRSGVNVVLGLEYLKTHCKLCVVIRKEHEGIKIYSHIGTGNYNDKTARLYTDISYLTAKQKIGYDLLHVFNILSGISTPKEKLQRVFYSPINLRERLLKCIDGEIENAKKGNKAEVFLKLNSINDPEMIDKLYEAADKGVHVTIICRGITCLVARKNLEIKSIVGRFLEHSRIYYFKKNGKGEYYISSADLLTRNLDRRVEIMLLVSERSAKKKLDRIIKVFKADERNSFIMDKEGRYFHSDGKQDAHTDFIEMATRKPRIKIAKKKKQ